MLNIFDLESSLNISAEDTYLVSYPYLVDYFSRKNQFSAADFVCGAHMVYGWMPTILKLNLTQSGNGLEDAAALLSKAKRDGFLTNSELMKMSLVTNNSLVGVSKLLHFISPNSFAIWDSRIYAFLYQERPYNYRVQDVEKYRFYLEVLNGYQQDIRFSSFHNSVNRKIGYEVSGLRALELVMFQNSHLIHG